MNTLIRLSLLSVTTLMLAACSDPPKEETASNPVVVEDAKGMGVSNESLQSIDLNTLGAQAALEDDKNYAVNNVPPVIYFAFDQYDIDDKGQATVVHYARYLNDNPQIKVVIEGHCDERGTQEYNMALGERRAHAVRDALIVQGVSPNRIKTVSFGEEKPAAAGHDESAWSLNRRSELRFPR